jgi:hypothetical protein
MVKTSEQKWICRCGCGKLVTSRTELRHQKGEVPPRIKATQAARRLAKSVKESVKNAAKQAYEYLTSPRRSRRPNSISASPMALRNVVENLTGSDIEIEPLIHTPAAVMLGSPSGDDIDMDWQDPKDFEDDLNDENSNGQSFV